jgi:hypothetical protein
VHLIDNGVQHAPALVVIEPRDLAGDPERRHAIDARLDEQIDDTPQAVFVNIPVGSERGGKD